MSKLPRRTAVTVVVRCDLRCTLYHGRVVETYKHGNFVWSLHWDQGRTPYGHAGASDEGVTWARGHLTGPEANALVTAAALTNRIAGLLPNSVRVLADAQ